MHQTQNQIITRKLNDPFFQTPIGKIIADAICNDCTYVLSKLDSIVIGEVMSCAVDLVYSENKENPMCRSNPVRYEDSLYLEDIELKPDDILYEVSKPNYKYSVLTRQFNPAFEKEFTAIWNTKVYVYNEHHREYSQKIRFIPEKQEKEVKKVFVS